MASQGPLFPGTTATVTGDANEVAEPWVNHANVAADDGVEAVITAATFDSPDVSERLKATNFGFTIPSGATINGIVVEIEKRSNDAGTDDYRVQLLDETGALVGDNKAQLDSWPITIAISTYGGATDTWNWTTVTDAKINDIDFGVVISAQSVRANQDVQIDFIRITVHYTETAGPQTVSPAVLSVSTTLPAPTVNQKVEPGALVVSTVLPAPQINQQVAPAALPIAATIPAPTVSQEGGAQTVSPGVLTVTATPVAPQVNQQTQPGTLSVSTVLPAPQVQQSVAPATLTVSTVLPSPTVHQQVQPGVLAITASVPAPTISVAGGAQTVSPGTLTITGTLPAPQINQALAPAALVISTVLPAPTINQQIAAAVLTVTITIPAPTISGGTAGGQPVDDPQAVLVGTEGKAILVEE